MISTRSSVKFSDFKEDHVILERSALRISRLTTTRTLEDECYDEVVNIHSYLNVKGQTNTCLRQEFQTGSGTHLSVGTEAFDQA